MRGKHSKQPNMFYALDVEALIRPDHPLRKIKQLVDEDLSHMGQLFNQAYSDTGRPSVPPERLLKALLLQALYTVRSENLLVERTAYERGRLLAYISWGRQHGVIEDAGLRR